MPVRSSIIASVVMAACVAVGAQTPAQETPAPGPAPGLAPREIQQMIDAYVLMQAETALGLSEEQFPTFVARLKALQDARRRQQQGRNRLIMELNRLTGPRAGGMDDSVIKDQLKALQDHDARFTIEIQKASEALDQVLTPRQQARLRVFEEQMERRKIDLLLRARRAAAGKRPSGL
jgi:Spy/CpxP family protein refolding chaperone